MLPETREAEPAAAVVMEGVPELAAETEVAILLEGNVQPDQASVQLEQTNKDKKDGQ
jgi:hypothetical protein